MDGEISTCGHERRPIPFSRRGKHLVVDIHAHLGIPAAEAMIRAQINNPPDPLAFTSGASNAINGEPSAPIGPKLNGWRSTPDPAQARRRVHRKANP